MYLSTVLRYKTCIHLFMKSTGETRVFFFPELNGLKVQILEKLIEVRSRSKTILLSISVYCTKLSHYKKYREAQSAHAHPGHRMIRLKHVLLCLLQSCASQTQSDALMPGDHQKILTVRDHKHENRKS